MTPTDRSSVWFITGCSTGLGRALAVEVLGRGYRCVVTARNRDQVRDLAASHPDSALALALDVTDAAQRERAVAQAEERFGAIDVLVNNAGHGYLAAVEEADIDEVRGMFETNFYGLVSMMQCVLPGMRARRRGHVVNVSSVGGLVGQPSSGFYNASKFAVEGISEALAKEVDALGIKVTLIEPGPFRTDFQGRSMHAVDKPIDDYAQAAARRSQLRASSGRQPGDPVRAAKAIVQVVESDSPPLHLVLGKVGRERVREKLNDLLRSMDEWDAVTVGADFPAESSG